MKSIIALILPLCTYCIECSSQYIWSGDLYRDNRLFKPGVSISGEIGFKGINNHLRIYYKITTKQKTTTLIKTLDLKTLTIQRVDTLNDSTLDFDYRDFIAGENTDVIIGHRKISVYNRVLKQILTIGVDSIIFSNGKNLNDSLIYLYHISNFHPKDAIPGLHGSIFHVQSMQFISTNKAWFPGVGLAHMNVDWVYANQRYIYTISPMTGILYQYNFKLQLIDSIEVPIKWSNVQANSNYNRTLDSLIYGEYKYTSASILSSGQNPPNKIYNSDFAHNTSKEVRSKYEYIERVFFYNDSTVIFSLYRPGYEFNKRDIIFFNVNTRSVIFEIDKWNCSIKNPPEKFEDFFPIDVSISPPYSPYFHSGKVYYPSFFNPTLYTDTYGVVDSLNRIMIKDGLKNYHKWTFIEYTISNMPLQ